MIISDYQIFKYSLPFIQPIQMMNQSLTTRDGMLVKFMSVDGHHAYGDVPPFPGLSDESIELAYIQLHDVCQSLIGRENPVRAWSPDRVSGLFPGLYPSVSFGIESALIDLAAQASHISIAEFFSPHPHSQIKTNGLVAGSLEELPERAAHLVNAGYRHLKIKVGRFDVDAEIQALKKLSDKIGTDIVLRLDANRSWQLDEALVFAHGVSGLNIEYIEEPLIEPVRLEEFYQKCNLPFALDESLHDYYESPPDGTAAFIIKPGIHGGVFECINFIKEARQHYLTPVLSSAFLSAVGLKISAGLASAFSRSEDAMGLDTWSWLKNDFLSTPLTIHNGELNRFELDRLVTIQQHELQPLGE